MIERGELSARHIAAVVERLGRLTRSLQQSHGIKPAQWEALRYLARANEFSRSPGALAAFLGSTRGTVSQTLITLERKGLIVRRTNPRDRRGTALELTDAGRRLVAADPLMELEAAARDLPDATRDSLADGLMAFLRAVQRRNDFRTFGICPSCRFLEKADGGYRCGLSGEALAPADASLICHVHAPSAA